jgi:hypothetical protein
MAEAGKRIRMARPRNFAIAGQAGTRYSDLNAVLT